jgi:hypothetical protein
MADAGADVRARWCGLGWSLRCSVRQATSNLCTDYRESGLLNTMLTIHSLEPFTLLEQYSV